MARPQSPLVGYNTNVRHRGKLYHIQTEDSGINHPHVITHLFADGGRIIASRKTSYAEYVGSDDLPNIVRKLMQQQHKGIFIELRDCVFDEDTGPEAEDSKAAPAQSAEAASDSHQDASTADGQDANLSDNQNAPVAAPPPVPPPVPVAPVGGAPTSEIQALELAAAQKSAESAAARGTGRYKQHMPAHGAEAQAAAAAHGESIFGGGLLKGKSLDEVILSYLADDLSDTER